MRTVFGGAYINSNIKMETLMDKNNSEQLLTEISQLLQKIEKKL
jgi:hypothetical protein